MEAMLVLAALFMSAVGAAIDLRTAKVPNWLTLSGLAAGLAARAFFAGWHGLASGALGAFLGGGALFLPFLARGIGGGDVKLMAAAGAWVGIAHVLALILATAIAGGLLAIGYIVYQGRTIETLGRMAGVIRFHLASGIEPRTDLDVASTDSIRFPYGLAIASGALVVLVLTALAMER